MKTGIITIHNHYNYGAVLQAYALNRIVRKLGHECKTIDCIIDPGAGRIAKRAKHMGAQITNFYNLYHWIANKRYDRRFREFISQHIPLTETCYQSIDHLVKEPPQFDAYITGSDQVWRPSSINQTIGDAFHLCFASPENSRLISYAPSFGVSDIPLQYSEKIRNYLMRYHSLSVREKRGQEIIYELTGRKAVQVLDPTLLLSPDEYETILRPSPVLVEYIMVYPMELGKNMAFLNMVKKIKKQLSLPVVCIFPLVFDFRWLLVADKVLLDVGPQEFLGLFKNASLVCTNSFHGTVFSIKYQKKFLGVPHSISNSRIYSLLEEVNLLDRQIENLEDQKVKEKLNANIDYKEVTQRLQKSINQSIIFLESALSI
jgi:hypothetical protein